jgi:hypothetical protein
MSTIFGELATHQCWRMLDNVSATATDSLLCIALFSVILWRLPPDKIPLLGLLQTLNGDGLKPQAPRRNQAVHT